MAVAELVRPIDADMVEGEGIDVASKLLEAARPRLVAGAVDLEIRERAIECVGDVTARFADVMDAELLKGAVSDLVEQLDREATRCSALRALAVIANSPRQSSTATPVLEKGGLGTCLIFPSSTTRRARLQQATLEALGALLRTLPPKSKLKDRRRRVYLDECVNLGQGLGFAPGPFSHQNHRGGRISMYVGQKAKTACENDVLPAALTLAASPFLQGAPLDGLADVFEAVALKGGGGALGFDALLSALPDAARVAKEEDPVRGSRQARKNVAVVIARLCAAADASTLKKAVANLVNQVGDENKLLAVTALGELGRRCDLSKLGAINTLTDCLGAGDVGDADEAKTAAAAALGSCVAGAPHELDGLLDALDEDPCPREYLLLIALREVVAHAPSDRIKSVALRLGPAPADGGAGQPGGRGRLGRRVRRGFGRDCAGGRGPALLGPVS